MVKKEAFREDLYFRLSVITITVPPLRQRGNDVLLLANSFLSKFATEVGKERPQFTNRALEALKSYAWPGNVRELENLVQRLIVMKEGPTIDVPDLPGYMRYSVDRGLGIDRTLAEIETQYISLVLASVNGNKTRAAEILGIDRKTLREKLKHVSNTNEE
jgi:DNA-binding NtrC family response regulator